MAETGSSLAAVGRVVLTREALYFLPLLPIAMPLALMRIQEMLGSPAPA